MEEQRKYCTILIKRRVSGDPGPPTSLAHGELAVNEVKASTYSNLNNSPLSSDIIVVAEVQTQQRI